MSVWLLCAFLSILGDTKITAGFYIAPESQQNLMAGLCAGSARHSQIWGRGDSLVWALISRSLGN